MAEKKLTIRVDANTAGLSRGMKQASAQVNTFGSSIQKGITRHAAGIRKTGMALAGLGAAMTAMSVVSIKAAADLEQQLAEVSTMLDKTTMEFMPKYEASLRSMSKEFGESTKTLSKGLYDILSASIPPAKALDVLAVSARAAVAGITDTGGAADAITTIINAYGLAAEDAGDVSDWLFAIVKKGKTTFKELEGSIGKTATVARMAGVSMEELGAMIATLTRAGVKTDQAMTAVLGVLRTFLKASDEGAKTAEVFGVTLDTNTLRTEGLVGVMKKLADANSEQLAQIFPNIRGLIGFSAALGDATGFVEDMDFMLDRAGQTEEAFAKQTDTLAFTFKQIKQEFHDVFVTLGKELLPIIKTELVPLIREAIEHMKGWIAKFKELSPTMKKFLLILGPLLIALGGLLMILPSLAVAIGVLSGPIGWIVLTITGLTAAFVYFYKTNKGFQKFIDESYQRLIKLGQGFYTLGVNIKAWAIWFKNNFVAIWKTIFLAIPIIADNALNNLLVIMRDFFLRGGWKDALSFVYESLLKAFGSAFTAVGNAFSIFKDNIMKWLGHIAEKMKPQNWLKKIKAPDWAPLFGGFEIKFGEMTSLADRKMRSLTEGVEVMWEPMPGWITPTFDAIKKGAGDTKKPIDDLNKTIKKLIGNFDYATLNAALLADKLKKAKEEAIKLGWTFGKYDYAFYLLAAKNAARDLDAELAKAHEEATKLGWTFGKYDYATLLVAANQAARDLADELKKAGEEALKMGWILGKYDYATLLVAANQAARDLADELKKAEEKALKLGWTLGKYDYASLLVASNQAARDLADELKKANEVAIKLGWTFGKYDYASLLVASNQAARDLQDELKKANEKATKLGWTLGKYDYATLLVAANEAARDLVDELKKANEKAIKLGWTLGKYDYAILLVAANEAARDLADELKKANEAATKLGWTFGKYDYTFYLLAAKEAARDLEDELKKANEAAIKLGWSFGKFDYTFYLLAAKEASRDLADELKKAEENAIKLGWAFGKYDYTFYLLAAKEAARDLQDELKKANEEAVKLGWTFGKYDYASLLVAAKNAARDLEDELKKAEEAAVKLGWTFGKMDYTFYLIEAKRAAGELNTEISLISRVVEFLGKTFKGLGATMKSAFGDAIVSILSGMQTITQAAQSLQQTMARAFAEMAVAAAQAENVMGAVIAGAAAIFTAFGIRIRATTTHFETAWGTIGRSMYYTNIQVGELGQHLKEAGELMYPLVGTTIEFGDAARYLEKQFREVGLAISETIGEAQTKLEGLYQSQVDLGASTTEKLISELDRYYDYRTLKEMSLDELLALSAETRLKIEQGTIKEIEETEAEREARQKDQAVSRLKRIEEQYAKEDELIRRKIALTEIEIKLLELKAEREANRHSARAEQLEKELGLMLENYHKGVEAYEKAEKRKQDATEKTAKTVEQANEDMTLSTETAADEQLGATEKATEDMAQAWTDLSQAMADEMRRMKEDGEITAEEIKNFIAMSAQQMAQAFGQSTQSMINSLSRIPTRIDFDIIGKLYMPSIPKVGSQSFNIYGKYRAPEIPGYQHGGMAGDELVLSKPITNWIRSAMGHTGSMGSTPSVSARSGGSSNPNSSVSVGPVTIQFPNVTSFKDWLEADPMTIKEVFDRKIYLAMREAAREGRISKAAVMMP